MRNGRMSTPEEDQVSFRKKEKLHFLCTSEQRKRIFYLSSECFSDHPQANSFFRIFGSVSGVIPRRAIIRLKVVKHLPVF